MLESISTLLANRTVNPTKNNVDVLAYGYELVLSTLFTSLLIVVTSALMGESLTGLIFIIFYVPVRVCAGGYHAKTFIGCNFITIAFFAGLVLVYRVGTIYFNAFVWLCTLFVSIITILFLAPHENSNQPMTPERRMKNRKNLKIRLLIETALILIFLRIGFTQVYVAILSLNLVATLLIIAKLMKGEHYECIVETD